MKQLQNQILAARGSDPVLLQRLCRELRTRIKMQQNKDSEENRYAQCFADTYLCKAYVELGKISEAQVLGLKNIRIQIREKYTELEILQSNIIGITYACEEDFENSSIWFLKTLELSKKYNDIEMSCTTYFNIAKNYYRLEEYEKTIYCCEKGKQLAMEFLKDTPYQSMVLDFYEISVALCEVRKNRFEQAKEHINRVQGNEYNLEIFLAKAVICIGEKDYNEAQNYVVAFLRGEQKKNRPFQSLMMYHEAFEIACILRQKELAERIVKSAYPLVKHIHLPNVYLQYCQDVIYGNKLFDWKIGIDTVYEKYYSWSKEASLKRQEGFIESLQNQMQIFSLQKKEDNLQKKLSRLEKGNQFDELTKVYNRATYEEFLQEALKEAKNKNTYLGIALISIDDFGKFNQLMGPEKTNQCIVAVAKAIKAAFLSKGRVYRISGGEFIVVSVMVPTLSYLQGLEKLLRDKNLENIGYMEMEEEKKLSLSIGAINARPNTETMAIEYTLEADKLMHIARTDAFSRYEYREDFSLEG